MYISFQITFLCIAAFLVNVGAEDYDDDLPYQGELSEDLQPPAPNQPIYYTMDEEMLKKDKYKRKKYNPELIIVTEQDDDLFKQKEIDCLLDNGKCSQKLGEIKNTIQKAFLDGCKSCTDSEKIEAGNAAAVLMFKQPYIWKQFLAKYDVNGVFIRQHS